MAINIDENNLRQGLLGLAVALVEIIKDALQTQALKRMESGDLTEEEVERLGEALMDLERAIEQIIEENGIAGAVRSVRGGLDDIVDDVIDKMINPERWQEVSIN